MAKDAGTGQYVVIENQLERTNHDHLGKAITYASVLNAASIVWVATKFSEEHIKALDWLNDNTVEDIGFYGVQIELWQIDESRPALRLNVVSRPNEAVRQVAKIKATEDLSQNRKFQFDFWTKFKDKLAFTKRIPSLHTPQARYWYNVSIGRARVHISNICNTDTNTVGIRIYISNKITDYMLPFLESKKEEIERSIGQSLLWNPNPENRDKIIALLHPTDFNDPKKLDEALEWLVEYTIKFRETFSPLVQQIRSPEDIEEIDSSTLI